MYTTDMRKPASRLSAGLITHMAMSEAKQLKSMHQMRPRKLRHRLCLRPAAGLLVRAGQSTVAT